MSSSFQVFTHYVKSRKHQHYEPYTHLRLWGYLFRLWKQPHPTFYRRGIYIAAKVKPIDKRWPTVVHKVRAYWLSLRILRRREMYEGCRK